MNAPWQDGLRMAWGELGCVLSGLALGLFFFGGLWWTIARLPTWTRPALAVGASLALRTGATVAGLLLVADGHWQRLLAGLAGFLLARLAMARWLRAGPPRRPGTGGRA